MDWIKLGRNVKYARARKGYTQAEVAELTGYSVQHLSHIENGTTKMSIDFMIALANTLEVSLDELFYDSLTVHKINDGYAYNKQVDMLPLFGGSESKPGDFNKLIANQLGLEEENIYGYIYKAR